MVEMRYQIDNVAQLNFVFCRLVAVIEMLELV